MHPANSGGFLFLTIFTVFSVLASHRAATPWCSPAATASWPLESVRNALAERGPTAEQLYALPRVPPDSAIRVTDERVCERAARAYYRYRLGPFPLGGVAVIRIGNRYAVHGDMRAGEWTILSIYSDEFELISSILS